MPCGSLEQQEIDLVLMDVQLPVLDGMETTQAIRKGEAGLEKIHGADHRHDRLRHVWRQGKHS